MNAATLAKACNLKQDLAVRWADPLTRAMAAYGIDTLQRQAMFLANCGHETQAFTKLVENLNYSADQLANTWKTRFKGADGKPNEAAIRLHHRPDAIANTVYANRMGNGDIESGDGWKYRGRGTPQLTGKDLYRACGIALSIDLIEHPEKLEAPLAAALAGGWFWNEKRLNVYADSGDFQGCVRKWNGGLIGLEDRMRKWVTARVVLGG